VQSVVAAGMDINGAQIVACDMARHRGDHYLAVVSRLCETLLSRFDDRVTHFTGAVAT